MLSWKYDIKMDHKKHCGMDSFESRQGRVTDSCKHGNELCDSIKREEFLEWMNDYWPREQTVFPGGRSFVFLTGEPEFLDSCYVALLNTHIFSRLIKWVMGKRPSQIITFQLCPRSLSVI
jgi:hypothetical protein